MPDYIPKSDSINAVVFDKSLSLPIYIEESVDSPSGYFVVNPPRCNKKITITKPAKFVNVTKIIKNKTVIIGKKYVKAEYIIEDTVRPDLKTVINDMDYVITLPHGRKKVVPKLIFESKYQVV